MLKNKNFNLTLLFGSFMFLQLITLRLANQAGQGILPSGLSELVYCFTQVAVILGYLVYALVGTVVKSEKVHRVITASVSGVCLVCSGIVLFSPATSAFYLAVTGVAVFLLGYIGGTVYHKISMLVSSKVRLGLCIWLGYASAIALQYVLQLELNLKPAVAAVLIFAFATMTFVLLKSGKIEDETPSKQQNLPVSKIIIACVIVLAMLLFSNYYNSYIHHLQISSNYGEYNVYTWPRLLMIPAIILFGVIGDIKGGKFLPLATLCISAVALLNAVLTGSGTYLLDMCLYYVSLTSVIAYYHLVFLRLAPKTKHPQLWASGGRIMDSVCVILSFIFGFSSFSAVTVVIMDIIALIAAIVLMAVNGDFYLTTVSPGKTEQEQEPPKEAAVPVEARFGLTPTELKVFNELVQTDDKQEVIASRLNISVSTLRHHITSIYKKTGVQTRAALYRLVNPL